VDSPARVGRIRTRRAAWLSAIAKFLAVLWIAGAATTAQYFTNEPAWVWSVGVLSGLCGAIAVMLMVWSYVASMWLGSSPGHASTRDRVLHVKKETYPVRIPFDEIVTAHVAKGGIAHLETRSDAWTLEMDDEADAHALVAELGFAPGGKPVIYRLGNRFRRFLHLGIAAVAYIVAAAIGTVFGGGAWPLLILVGLYMFGKRLLRAPVVTVGSDGVAIQTGFGRRVLPVSASVDPVEILFDRSTKKALAEHLRALREKPPAQAPIVLAREGRSIREWRDRLRQAMDGGYRVAAAHDALGDLVTAPGVSREERVGAALALRAAGDSNLPRIRVAAEQCVDPKTRAALDALAAEEIDEQAIEKALS